MYIVLNESKNDKLHTSSVNEDPFIILDLHLPKSPHYPPGSRILFERILCAGVITSKQVTDKIAQHPDRPMSVTQ